METKRSGISETVKGITLLAGTCIMLRVIFADIIPRITKVFVEVLISKSW